MKYGLLILLGLVSCSDVRPKHVLGDTVSIKVGFYKGCRGHTEALKGSPGRYRYVVRLTGCNTYYLPSSHLIVEEAEL